LAIILTPGQEDGNREVAEIKVGKAAEFAYIFRVEQRAATGAAGGPESEEWP
jgi:hypothetical protein